MNVDLVTFYILGSYERPNNCCMDRKNLDVLSGTYSIDEKYTFAPGYCREQRRKKTFLSRGNIHYILILV